MWRNNLTVGFRARAKSLGFAVGLAACLTIVHPLRYE
jgi:hypothetical protein